MSASLPESGLPETTSASHAAAVVLRGLVDAGMRHLVLSPGSRSQALALEAARLERMGELAVHVRIDERSAGFLALGLALESGIPVAVVTTSGTAVANLHPAMLEAWHSGVPLIAITADRPAEVRGTGANQTTTQPGIFGPAAVFEADVRAGAGIARLHRSLGGAWATAINGAPVHLNVSFREPLSGPVPEIGRGGSGVLAVDDPAAPPLSRGPRTVIIAGTGAGPQAEEFAHASGWPLLAEVTSGSRFGRSAIPAYRAALARLGHRIERAIVFGRPNLSREVPALLQRDDVEVIVVESAGAEQFRPGGRGTVVPDVAVDAADPVTEQERAWFGEWLQAGRALAEDPDDLPYTGGSGSDQAAVRGALAREELAAVRAPNTRRSLVEAIWRASWPHDRLFLAASRLVREADLVVPGKKITVRANRGLAGIDGSISSAIGIAIASQLAEVPGTAAAGATRALLGDLAFLHDVGGLLQAPGERAPRVQLIVGNDHGGTIFDGLEVAGTADRTDFERVMITPHAVDIASLAAAYGWHYTLATDRGTLDRALTAPPAGLSIVEVPLDR
ncbi:2-succinyl-5-enolpyruvyl-6-hydroxy-3-cyclohexene-1-carboxylic-acid synthase [Naasia lichenicola]|uniref:2-succinyl-5-enolpyruvyl-6-hydroxy-3- cyclohexene-1-carboxylic-acid synthase n=1 Tax=Naasia lichenicola TaxID=2565933 RepID=UPI0026B7FA22